MDMGWGGSHFIGAPQALADARPHMHRTRSAERSACTLVLPWVPLNTEGLSGLVAPGLKACPASILRRMRFSGLGVAALTKR